MGEVIAFPKSHLEETLCDQAVAHRTALEDVLRKHAHALLELDEGGRIDLKAIHPIELEAIELYNIATWFKGGFKGASEAYNELLGLIKDENISCVMTLPRIESCRIR